jgi:hypothetical protein
MSQSGYWCYEKSDWLLVFCGAEDVLLWVAKLARADWRNKKWQLKAKSDKYSFVSGEYTTPYRSGIHKIFCVFVR